jgi:hypothetical protein
MHRRTLLIPLVFALALGACSSTRTYTVEDLGRLVLQRDEAPRGTSLDASSSGLEDLDELAEDDEVKKRGLQEAGFIRGRFQLFITDETVGEGSKGVLASSFALLFETADGAHRGMSVFKDAIERWDGSARTRPARRRRGGLHARRQTPTRPAARLRVPVAA